MINGEIRKNLRHNLIANLMDGSFFGFAIGFASFVTIIPLFVSNMTSSAVLIGLIPAIHSVGWQLPQLLMAPGVSRQRFYKPVVMAMTIHERLPFIGLALIAWFLPRLGVQWGLFLTFVMLIWQGLGGGFSATAWQAMIGKIIPANHRGSFYGMQSSLGNLLGSGGALAAGFILSRLGSPLDFTLCFILAALSMMFSYFWLGTTREPEKPADEMPAATFDYWAGVRRILRRDPNFRGFLAARMLSQMAVMGVAFYTVYAVNDHGVSEVQVGVLTSLLMAVQIVANPIMGWLGDRWSHRAMMQVGIMCAILSALLAWIAPGPAWFYVVFGLAGIANVAVWTLSLAMILEFGPESDRPAYIALANTLVAPATILAPLIGGWLADLGGYSWAFIASALGGLVTMAVFQFYVRDPRTLVEQASPVPSTD